MCQNLPAWACPSASEEVCVYYTPASLAVSDEQIAQAVIDLSKDGATCIIPNLSAAVDVYLAQQVLPHSMAADQQSQQRLAQAALEQEQDGVILAFYRRVYGVMVQAALRCGMKIAFHPDQPLERLVVRASDGAMHACMLTRREYYLSQEQHAQLVLSGQGTRMSTVAVDQRDGDTVDLSQWVTAEHSLDWDVPTGNWCVQEFLCCEDPAPHANYLNYDASCAYLQASFALLEDLFAGERRTVLGALYLDDIGFHAPNRRSWSPDFNMVFEQLHGCDPAPWYPHLYEHEDHRTPHIKALMLQARAWMLQRGIYRALADMADTWGVRLLCSALEPKLSAPSAISGDAVANQAVASCAVLNRAYAYGLHSLKIAAAGEINYGKRTVACELCRDYTNDDTAVLYRESMHALVRGCNLLLAHTEGNVAEEERASYLGFARRAGAILQQGKRVSDLAMLYPIHALHASVSFYESSVYGFEYPGLPSFADYTSLMQSVISYTGRDVALLHPDVVSQCAEVEDGQLVLRSETGTSYFDVLLLPSAGMLTPQMATLAKRFYEEGGCILATGELLAKKAFCSNASQAGESADDAIAACMCAIFGDGALDPTIVVPNGIHENEAGGRAAWLYPWQTAADGTMIADSESITRTLEAFAVPPDVDIPDMPRYRECGILGMPYPEFSGLRLPWVLPGGGVLEYMHKHCGQHDMYYFVNTRDSAFAGDVYLRGVHKALQTYDPMTEQTTDVVGEVVLRHGCSYTRFTLALPKISSLFVFS